MTVPNWVTLSRLLGLPVIPAKQPLKLAGGIFLIAAITDWVDGYLANSTKLLS